MSEDSERHERKGGPYELPRFRLFVLGSGFSKPAGHPLGIELLEMVRERMRQQFRLHGWDGPLEREISEWRSLYPKATITLESVLAYSHRKHFLKLNGSDEYFDHGSRTIVAAREIIQGILSPPIRQETIGLYERFAGTLKPNDVVLTFNYDTVLEDTLDGLQKAYSLTPEWWLDDRNYESNGGSRPPQFIDVLKLHGSIDWYDRRYYDESRAYFKAQSSEVEDRDPLFGASAHVPIESLARGETAYGKDLISRVFRVPNHRKYFPFRSRSFTEVPFLLPPAFDKILGHDPIRDLWSNLHRTMNALSMITIIGYSMPSYDAYAYEALGDLIIDYQSSNGWNSFEQEQVPVQIITKADSVDSVLASIPFLVPEKTRIWTDGFDMNALDWLDWGR